MSHGGLPEQAATATSVTGTVGLIRHHYDRVAAIYDRRWHSYLTHSLSALVAQTPLTGDEAVLDVACGTGELERLWGAQHPDLSVTGIDLSASMLAIAQSKLAAYPQLTLCQGQVGGLPFPPQHFDLVVTANAFHHFPDPHKALLEMGRVLKAGGRLVVMDWCRDYLLGQLCDLVLQRLDPSQPTCDTLRELVAFYQGAELTVTHSARCRAGVLWGIMVVTAVRDPQ